MRVGLIGQGNHAAARRRAIAAYPGTDLAGVLEAVPDLLSAVQAGEALSTLERFFSGADVVFITAPANRHYALASAAARQGRHVFLEWPPASSIKECMALVRLAEEAGIEIGVSRPLRFHPVLQECPPAWRATLILLRQTISQNESPPWTQHLAAAADLCCALAGSSVQRVDAEAARIGGTWPDAVAFTLRYHSGAYAQVSLQRSTTTAPALQLYVGGSGFQLERTLLPVLPLEAETHAFLQAVAERRPAPVSVLDGLHTARLIERLMHKLRS